MSARNFKDKNSEVNLILEPYRNATRYFTRVIVDNFSEKKYISLKNPNNRSNGQSDFFDLKARFRVISRPIEMIKTGRRNLNIGNIEILLFLHNNFKDKNDFFKGFTFNHSKARYRFVFGGIFYTPTLASSINEEFGSYLRHGGKAFLEAGNYEAFLEETTRIVDDNLTMFKEISISEGYIV